MAMEELGAEASTIYRQLNDGCLEIRILHLYPSDSLDSPLECHLETVSLDAKPEPQYEAISYVWAECNGAASLTIDEIVKEIPASAVNVLRQFRLQNEVRRLWIDAVCINQGDVQERSAQVAMMNKIYGRSQRALIWLGDADDTTEEALRDINAISTFIYPLTVGWCDEQLGLFDNTDIMAQLASDESSDLFRLFRRPWFSRIWVLQECMLAPQSICRCGHLETDWRDVCRAAACLLDPTLTEEMHVDIEDSSHFNNASIPMLGLSNVLEGFSLQSVSWLYQMTNALKSTDPRDKFYAILGLSRVSSMASSKQARFGLEVDYTRPVGDVLRDATRFALTEGLGFSLLYNVDSMPSDEGRERSSLPSWVPDWNLPQQPYQRVVVGPGMVGDFDDDHAADVALIEADIGSNRLVLKGFEIDQVEHTFPYFDLLDSQNQSIPPKNFAAFLEERSIDVLAFFQSCLDFVIIKPYNPTLIKEMILTMSKDADSIEHFDDITVEQCIGFLWRLARRPYIDAIGKPSPEDMLSYLHTCGRNLPKNTEDIVWLYSRHMILTCSKHRLFSTSRGRIGLGSQHTEVGDHVVGFLGSNRPFVLRPKCFNLATRGVSEQTDYMPTQRSPGYRLMGVCFMNKFVRDNEMLDLVKSGVGLRTFDIW